MEFRLIGWGLGLLQSDRIFLGNSEFSPTDDMAKIIDYLPDEVTLHQFH
jgi:hypothetical protein